MVLSRFEAGRGTKTIYMITEKLVERARSLSAYGPEYIEAYMYAERNNYTSIGDISIAVIVAMRENGKDDSSYNPAIENWVADHILYPEEQYVYGRIQTLFPEEWEKGYSRYEGHVSHDE